MKIYWVVAYMIAISCGQQQASEKAGSTAADTMSSKPSFAVNMVDNAKDPVCGMPVKAGISDTVHYNHKLYGFCSKGCKSAFESDKARYAASAKMKKDSL